MATVIGAGLPLLGVDFAGDTLSGIVGVAVLSFVATLDVVIGRFLMIPSLRAKGQTRGSVESVALSTVESTGIMAILAGVGTGWAWATLFPAIIGLYGWMAVRRYFEEWVE